MINLSLSGLGDLEQLKEWTAADPYHFHQGQPEWWLTDAPGSLLAFLLTDEEGPLAFVRFDLEGEYLRLHTQFAPEEVVSKKRLVIGILEGLNSVMNYYKPSGAKGVIFNSVNPGLILFMDHSLGFKSVGNDDYRLDFEGH